MLDIIYKKRDGNALSKEEIDFFIEGYTRGDIPDYQAAALLMAIYFQDVTDEETFHFTDAMLRSGEILDLSEIPGIKVDKHSTGGVGDKTTLIVGPICAACGVPVAKMSGRGLGFTGGTIDKLEAIPGLKTAIDQQEFRNIVKDVGLSVIGQTAHIAAADKKLYALRDVTATVDNRGMITASIMSKKLASGSDAILLDVKAGDGAFMKTEEEAVNLAQGMVEIGNRAGRKMAAFVTDMSQPLGKSVGNALEVMEAIDTLKGKGPKDITELAVSLGGYMVYLGGKAASYEAGMEMARACLADGRALQKLAAFIGAQGGNGLVTENYELFPKPAFQLDILSPDAPGLPCKWGEAVPVTAPWEALLSGSEEGGEAAERDKGTGGAPLGYVAKIQADLIGSASQLSGAGRAKKEDSIDLAAGIHLRKKVGDAIFQGEALASIYGCDPERLAAAGEKASSAYTISGEPLLPPALIKTIITG